MHKNLIYIHPEAKVASNVHINPFTSIDKNVEIGEGTWISSNVTIMEGARIGKNCKIFPGAVIGAIPQDLKFSGEDSLAIIGDNTVIRECVTVNRGTLASHQTVVGSDCLLMAYVHVAHDCVVGNHCILANAVQLAGHVQVGDYAVVGGASAVHQFTKIGAHTMIAGGALVRKDVPPYTRAGRDPLVYCGINTIGLRRRGFSNDAISQIQEIYRNIFMKGLNHSKALEIVEAEINNSAEKDEIIQFIKTSERGIIKGSTQWTKEED